MRTIGAVSCPRRRPRAGALQALGGLDSFPSHGLPPKAASSRLCPTALRCLRQPMERDFLAPGTSLFCLKTPVYTCTASELEQGRLAESCFPLDGGSEMSEVSVFFLQKPLQNNATNRDRAGICWVFIALFFSFALNQEFPGYLKSHQNRQNCYVVCMAFLVLLLDYSVNCSITDVCSFCVIMFSSLFESSWADLVKSTAFRKRWIRAFSFQNLSHTSTSGYTHPYCLRFVYKEFGFYKMFSNTF